MIEASMRPEHNRPAEFEPALLPRTWHRSAVRAHCSQCNAAPSPAAPTSLSCSTVSRTINAPASLLTEVALLRSRRELLICTVDREESPRIAGRPLLFHRSQLSSE